MSRDGEKLGLVEFSLEVPDPEFQLISDLAYYGGYKYYYKSKVGSPVLINDNNLIIEFTSRYSWTRKLQLGNMAVFGCNNRNAMGSNTVFAFPSNKFSTEFKLNKPTKDALITLISVDIPEVIMRNDSSKEILNTIIQNDFKLIQPQDNVNTLFFVNNLGYWFTISMHNLNLHQGKSRGYPRLKGLHKFTLSTAKGELLRKGVIACRKV